MKGVHHGKEKEVGKDRRTEERQAETVSEISGKKKAEGMMDTKELVIAAAFVFVAYSLVKKYYETQEAKKNATYPSESRYVGIWQNYQNAIDQNPNL